MSLNDRTAHCTTTQASTPPAAALPITPNETEPFARMPMIPQSTEQNNPKPWQRQLAEAFRDLPALLDFIQLSISDLAKAHQTSFAEFLLTANTSGFPLRVPQAYATRIRPGDAKDPLLLQVLPQPQELETHPGFVHDPLHESQALAGQGLLQKYHGRLLVIAHNQCAVHCRYCFRRHFPYAEQHLPPNQWQHLADHIAQDKSLNEIILSGGDPLTLKNHHLELLTPLLYAHPHIRRLRLHTRFPVMIPDRLDSGFLTWASALPIPLVLVLHINHAQEIDQALAKAIQPLRQNHITLLNQSVLLRGINDSVDAQQQLQERLMDIGILPYYLHLLDPVHGAQHFDVPLAQAQTMMQQLRARLPGYLVPRLVHEEPGAPAKTLAPLAL
ncbi:MAG: EF-P beta-lysylation protein EpmB [Gammaproteobacteria bacterium]